MPWTLSPQNARKDVPKMKLKEYQQSTGQLMASIFYFSRTFQNVDSLASAGNTVIGRSDALAVYKDKYFGTATGFEYILPYFSEAHTGRSTNFTGENDSQLSKIQGILPSILTNSSLGSMIGNAYSVMQGAKAAADVLMTGKINFEFPERWESTANESYSTTFDLFNTTTLEDVKANRKFCHLFSYQNTPSRRSFAIMDPPVIYSLSIPGVVDIPVCYVDDLSITNLGNVREMKIDGVSRNIPEAYRIAITFRSLLMPTRNLMEATESGKTVQVIGDRSEYNDHWASQTEDALLNAATGGAFGTSTAEPNGPSGAREVSRAQTLMNPRTPDSPPNSASRGQFINGPPLPSTKSIPSPPSSPGAPPSSPSAFDAPPIIETAQQKANTKYFSSPDFLRDFGGIGSNITGIRRANDNRIP